MITVAAHILSEEEIKQLRILISSELVLTITQDGKYRKKSPTFFLYNLDNDTFQISVPFNFGIEKGYAKEIAEVSEKPTGIFKVNLRDYQVKPVIEIEKILSEERSILIDMPTGFGKTVISSYLSCKMKGKVAVLMKNDLTFQWSETIKTFTSLSVCVYTNTDKCREECLNYDVVIFTTGRIVTTKNGKKKELPFHIANAFHCLFVDECHTICTTVGIQALKQFTVEKLCLLSATPQRADGNHLILGKFYKTKYRIPRTKAFVYNSVYTGITGVEKYNNDGLIYHELVSSLMYNDTRNNKLVKYVLDMHRNITMIVTNELKHVDIIYDSIISRGETCEKITAKAKQKRKNKTHSSSIAISKYYVATIDAVGEGFDLSSYIGINVEGEKNIDHLVLACTRKEDSPIEQLFGRAFRSSDPMISVLTDNNSVIQKHNIACIAWSNKNGCKKINVINWDGKKYGY